MSGVPVQRVKTYGGPVKIEAPYPKVAHFVWIGPPRPRWFESCLSRFREVNPDFDVVVHDESSLHDDMKPLYDQVKWIESKADLVRLCALFDTPGWYFDADFIALRPMSELPQEYDKLLDLFVVPQKLVSSNPRLVGISNGCFALRDGEWFAKVVGEQLQWLAGGQIRREVFGPMLFTRLARLCPVTWGRTTHFYPIPGSQTSRARRLAKRILLKDFEPDFGDCKPFLFHFWMTGQTRLF